jgi:hypothetical protein
MLRMLVFLCTYAPFLCTCRIFCLVGSCIPTTNCIQKVLDSDSGGINNYSKLPNSLLSLASPVKDKLSSWSVLRFGRLLSYFWLLWNRNIFHVQDDPVWRFHIKKHVFYISVLPEVCSRGVIYVLRAMEGNCIIFCEYWFMFYFERCM